MSPFLRRQRVVVAPPGVNPKVAALVDKLRDPKREVDDWVHSALTLPQTVETPEDQRYAVSVLVEAVADGSALSALHRRSQMTPWLLSRSLSSGLVVGFFAVGLILVGSDV